MIKICIEVDDNCTAQHRDVRLFPRLGKIVEQSSPVVKSPKFARTLKVRNLLMAFTLTATQEVNLTIEPKDKKGNPAKLDGVPEWTTDNSELLTLTPAPDGLSCSISAVGTLGTALVQVTGDADMGAGSTPIIGTLEVEITGGTATVVTVVPGTATEQP